MPVSAQIDVYLNDVKVGSVLPESTSTTVPYALQDVTIKQGDALKLDYNGKVSPVFTFGEQLNILPKIQYNLAEGEWGAWTLPESPQIQM